MSPDICLTTVSSIVGNAIYDKPIPTTAPTVPIIRYSMQSANLTWATVCPTARRAPIFTISLSILFLIVNIIIIRQITAMTSENDSINAAIIFTVLTKPILARSVS